MIALPRGYEYIVKQFEIHVDGACRDNGREGAESAIGVFIHDNCKNNVSLKLNDPHPTNQRAELQAAIRALEIASIRASKKKLGPGDRVLIISDSKYLVDAMNNWIFKWKDNGYINSKGESVVNQSFFKRLDELERILKEGWGINTEFIHVPRNQNRKADELANQAFDGKGRSIDPRTWVLTSSNYHMCHTRESFVSYTPIIPVKLHSLPFGPMRGCYALGYGTVHLTTIDTKGKVRNRVIKDVIHTPTLSWNLTRQDISLTPGEIATDTLRIVRQPGVYPTLCLPGTEMMVVSLSVIIQDDIIAVPKKIYF